MRTVVFKASIAVFPVTKIEEGFFPSQLKFCRDNSVGAKLYVEMMLTAWRLNSSGGGIDVVSAEACFHVTNRYLKIETGKSCHESGRCISMNEDYIRPFFLQNFTNSVQDIRSHIEKGLTILHDRQIVIRDNFECLQHLIQHLAVLSGDADDGLDCISALEFIDPRAHFNGLWTGAEDQHDSFHMPFLSYNVINVVHSSF